MAILEIVTRNDLPSTKQTVQLDGVNFQILVYFNQRMADGVGKWMILLSDENGNPLAGPVPVVVTWPLFDRFKANGIPPGTIFALDTAGNNKDPGQFDLGNRVRLMYAEAGTL